MKKSNSKIKKFNTQDRDKPIIVSANDDDVKEYLCLSCNRTRHTRQSTGELECLYCGETISIEGARKRSKLSTPEGRFNTETCVSSIPSPHDKDNVRIKHEPDLQWGAKSLSQKGTIKFTSYEER